MDLGLERNLDIEVEVQPQPQRVALAAAAAALLLAAAQHAAGYVAQRVLDASCHALDRVAEVAAAEPAQGPALLPALHLLVAPPLGLLLLLVIRTLLGVRLVDLLLLARALLLLTAFAG